IGEGPREAARAAGLALTETVELDSMIRAGGEPRLGDLRALGEGYPLRGAFRLVDAPAGVEREAGAVPEPGTLWMSRAGAELLGARVGEEVGIGELQLRLVALVTRSEEHTSELQSRENLVCRL